MRHLLVARSAGLAADAPELDHEYELTEREAEALLDDGVIEHCDLHSDDRRAVYHVAQDFDDAYPEGEDLWREVEERLCRLREAAEIDSEASHVLVIGDDVQLRSLSQSEAERLERLENDGVIYADKYFGGARRTIYHVSPEFREQVAPEPVAEAIEEQLDTIPCRARKNAERKESRGRAATLRSTAH
jgi:hypothetical protein